MPSERDGLEHTHAVALGVGERDILPTPGISIGSPSTLLPASVIFLDFVTLIVFKTSLDLFI